MKKLYLAFVLPVFFVSACTSNPTVGDKIIQQSENTNEIGNMWNKGDKLVKNGEAKIREGQKLIDQGNSKTTEGASMVKQGKQMINESEMLYKQRFPNGKVVQ